MLKHRVLDAVDGGLSTTAEIAAYAGMTRQHVAVRLWQLRQMGAIRRVGYSVTDKGRVIRYAPVRWKEQEGRSANA